MSAGVRQLFEVELPRFLEEHGAFEGFRCRFYVHGAGAWEVDLRPFFARCIEADRAPGCYEAWVTLDARDWGAANLRELVDAGRVKVELTMFARPGDGARAEEMLAALFRAPPVVWPASLRVDPPQAAFMRATNHELLAAMPGWTPPLDAPRPRRVINPFTREVGEIMSTVPQFIPSAPAPGIPPLPFAEIPVFGMHWGDDLEDFWRAFAPDVVEQIEGRLDDPHQHGVDLLRESFPDGLFGGGSVLAILAVPHLFTSAAAAHPDEAWVDLALRITRQESTAKVVGRAWREVGKLARTAQAQGQALWFWGRRE
jgi:hypothetical protein